MIKVKNIFLFFHLCSPLKIDVIDDQSHKQNLGQKPCFIKIKLQAKLKNWKIKGDRSKIPTEWLFYWTEKVRLFTWYFT